MIDVAVFRRHLFGISAWSAEVYVGTWASSSGRIKFLVNFHILNARPQGRLSGIGAKFELCNFPSNLICKAEGTNL